MQKGQKVMKKNKLLRKKINIRKLIKTNFWKRKVYLKEDSSSSDEDDSDSDSRRVLFMALEETIENNEDNYEEEGEVNLEAELISTVITDFVRAARAHIFFYYS